MKLQHFAVALVASLALLASSGRAQTDTHNEFRLTFTAMPAGLSVNKYGELDAKWHGTPVHVYVWGDLTLIQLGASLYGPLPIEALDYLDDAQTVAVTTSFCLFVNDDHYAYYWFAQVGSLAEAVGKLQAQFKNIPVYSSNLCE